MQLCKKESCVGARTVFSDYIVVGDVVVIPSWSREKRRRRRKKNLLLRLIESFPVQKANGVR
jgi:hypothetical protein